MAPGRVPGPGQKWAAGGGRVQAGWRSEVQAYGRKVAPAAAIFAAVGVLVAAWAAAGVIPLLIVRGLDLVSGRFFLVSAALVTALVAFATGTSWGTVATVGVALMGVGRGLGVDPAAAAGAVVAGAHFGDKLSPLSETATLAAAVVGTDLYTHIRHTVWTTVPAFLTALAAYLVLGLQAGGAADQGAAAALRAALLTHFQLHPALWLPVVLVVAAALWRWPVVPSLLASGLLAMALAVILQGFPAAALPRLAWSGYAPATGNPALDQLLAQGGIAAMAQVALAALGLFAAVMLAVRSGPGRRLLARLARAGRTPARAVALAVAMGLGLMLTSGASYLAILVTGELLRDAFRQAGLAPENLSRTLEDAGTVVAPLVPWGVSGLFMARTLDVSTWAYAPYAVVNYMGFAFALLYGYTGWCLRRLNPTP